MLIQQTTIDDLVVLEPEIYSDRRGCFFESFNNRKFTEVIGRQVTFVQDNHSVSHKDVIRGLHYQVKTPQAKLVRVINGSILDIAVDMRRSSPTFGCHVSVILSCSNRKIFWIPEGFAHGFLVLSKTAEVLYKTNEYRQERNERCVIWDDRSLKLDWRNISPILSDKDANGDRFDDAEYYD